VRGFLSQPADKEPAVEYVPTLQYIFRHNRAIFWTVRDQIPEWIGNNVFIRFFMGWMFPPLVTFLKLPATPAIKHEMMNHRVYQDIVLPVRTIEPAIERSAELFGIWPILVYPSRVYDHGPGKRGLFPTPEKQDIVPGTNYAMYYDLGVYGIPRPVREGRPDDYKAVASMRKMEHYVRSVSGAPFLYADTFLKPDEFEDMFNMELYNTVRKKFKAEGNFPTVYQKTTHSRTVDQLLADEAAYKKNK
jgi:delta24-sterol reductase